MVKSWGIWVIRNSLIHLYELKLSLKKLWMFFVGKPSCGWQRADSGLHSVTIISLLWHHFTQMYLSLSDEEFCGEVRGRHNCFSRLWISVAELGPGKWHQVDWNRDSQISILTGYRKGKLKRIKRERKKEKTNIITTMAIFLKNDDHFDVFFISQCSNTAVGVPWWQSSCRPDFKLQW